MKSNFYVEYQGTQVEYKELVARAKGIWTGMGNKVKDLETLNLYVKPDENSVYYVFNEDVTGHFPL